MSRRVNKKKSMYKAFSSYYEQYKKIGQRKVLPEWNEVFKSGNARVDSLAKFMYIAGLPDIFYLRAQILLIGDLGFLLKKYRSDILDEIITRGDIAEEISNEFDIVVDLVEITDMIKACILAKLSYKNKLLEKDIYTALINMVTKSAKGLHMMSYKELISAIYSNKEVSVVQRVASTGMLLCNKKLIQGHLAEIQKFRSKSNFEFTYTKVNTFVPEVRHVIKLMCELILDELKREQELDTYKQMYEKSAEDAETIKLLNSRVAQLESQISNSKETVKTLEHELDNKSAELRQVRRESVNNKLEESLRLSQAKVVELEKELEVSGKEARLLSSEVRKYQKKAIAWEMKEEYFEDNEKVEENSVIENDLQLELIREKRLVILGGDELWQAGFSKYLKERDIRHKTLAVRNVVEIGELSEKDVVICYTRNISHAYYYSVVDQISSSGAMMVLIRGSNFERALYKVQLKLEAAKQSFSDNIA